MPPPLLSSIHPPEDFPQSLLCCGFLRKEPPLSRPIRYNLQLHEIHPQPDAGQSPRRCRGNLRLRARFSYHFLFLFPSSVPSVFYRKDSNCSRSSHFSILQQCKLRSIFRRNPASVLPGPISMKCVAPASRRAFTLSCQRTRLLT